MKNILKILGIILGLAIIVVAVALLMESNTGNENVVQNESKTNGQFVVDDNILQNENSLNDVENEVGTNETQNEVTNETTDNEEDTEGLNIESAKDLSKLIDDIYAKQDMEMPALQTQEIDMKDEDTVKYMTGLEDVSDLDCVVVSEPMMSSQAYSLVLVKVKKDANVEEIAKEMNDNIDTRKWICVTAEKVYTTSSDNVIFLVMSRDELASPIYETFKDMAGDILGKEYERAEEIEELPADM